MSIDIEKCFAQNTQTRRMKNGRVEIYCKRGLWAVFANSEEEAMREAKHYFLQYLEDGEYDAHD